MYLVKELVVGLVVSKTVTVTPEQVEHFAKATGDRNPIHFDDATAIKAGFSARVAHGQLVAALANPMLTDAIDGIILRKQTVEYLHGVVVGDEVVIAAKLSAIRNVGEYALALWDVTYHSQGKLCFEMKASTMLPLAIESPAQS